MDKKDKNSNTPEKGESAWTVKRLRKSTAGKLNIIKAKMFVDRQMVVTADDIINGGADLYIKKYKLD